MKRIHEQSLTDPDIGELKASSKGSLVQVVIQRLGAFIFLSPKNARNLAKQLNEAARQAQAKTEKK